MRNLLNPKWLFLINTLPLVVLFVLLLAQFNIIKSLLDDDAIQVWKSFGWSLGILGLLNLVYTVYLTLKDKSVSIWYGFIALLCYIPFIYLYGTQIDKIIPFSVPQWMISGNIFLYVGTFLMPTLVYSLFVLVTHFTPNDKEHKAWLNLLIAMGVPIAGYLFAVTILPMWRYFESGFSTHAFIVVIITGTLVFLFFLIRAIYIVVIKRTAVWKKYQLPWKIPIAILFPLLGLFINNDGFSKGTSGFFGDFNNTWFYILAVINGIMVCLPSLNNKLYRLLIFISRSIMFAFTLYFFIVFLPFLPLSVIAIIAVGTGFLMLTPLLLFVIHSHELSKDYIYLKSLYSEKILIGISVLGFLVIPTFITVTYLRDKHVLNETLSYLYSPDYSKEYDIDKTSLQKTLNVIKKHKLDGRNGILVNGTPYLTTYFNWLVLDNLTISDLKIHYIERVFFGKAGSEQIQEFTNINKEIKISKISTNSTYDKSKKEWKTWVDLEITNKINWLREFEFATTIDLPEGCWISDYYLYVGNKKEYGILAEKKSAMWIFSQIRNENKDPGILYYLTGNKVYFSVFPFSNNEVRRTGIEFLHKEPIKISIDGTVIELGKPEARHLEKVETENAAYISPTEKQKLKLVKRKPYFHFLVDVSAGKGEDIITFTNRIQNLIGKDNSLSENAKISFVNSFVNTTAINKDWKKIYTNQQFEGGFFLERAIRKTLYDAYQDKSPTYPVIVVVTDDINKAVLDKDFTDFRFAFPENQLFYNLSSIGTLRAHSLIENPSKELQNVKPCLDCDSVLLYRFSDNSVAYLPNNPTADILLKKDEITLSETDIKEKDWKSALNMQAQWLSQILHPENSDKEWLNIVKCSFISKVMTPVTSYLVVENEAQKAMLKKKQKQALAGNRSLDLGEDTLRMSEPSLVILIILFGFIVWYRKKRLKQRFDAK